VISTKIVESLGAKYGKGSVDVWTRRESREIFVGNPFVRNIYVSVFPIRIPGRSYVKAVFGSALKSLALRRKGYQITLSTSGDIRETLLQRLAGGKQIAPVFSRDHDHCKMIRLGHLRVVNRAVQIPDKLVNKYEIVNELIRSLGLSPMPPRLYSVSAVPYVRKPDARRVGLHIGAFQAIKTLPVSRWSELAKSLVDNSQLVTVFSEPGGLPSEIAQRFQSIGSRVRLVSGDLNLFLTELTECRLLIAGDTFAIHAANAISVQTLMLSGSIPPIFAPPKSYTLEGRGTCGNQPCWNKPTCLGTENEISCLKAITPSEISEVVKLEEKTTGSMGAALVNPRVLIENIEPSNGRI
jgi:heptosyltransferase-3